MGGYWVVIPAAGQGKRMGVPIPKQYLPLHGGTVLEKTITRLLQHPQIMGIVVAIGQEDTWWSEVADQLALQKKPVHTVWGGQERYHSVYQGICHLTKMLSEDGWVLVHDAVRPCVRVSDLERLIQRATCHPVGAILATPVRDTLKHCDKEQQIEKTVDRSSLWHALTPQMFRLGELRSALDQVMAQGAMITDEASALEYVGKSVQLVQGSQDNIKITHPEDLNLASFILMQQEKESSDPLTPSS